MAMSIHFTGYGGRIPYPHTQKDLIIKMPKHSKLQKWIFTYLVKKKRKKKEMDLSVLYNKNL